MQRRFAKMNSTLQSGGRAPPTPSPHSTDDLLPTLEEDKQVNLKLNPVITNLKNTL